MKLNNIEIHNFLSIKYAKIDFESYGNLVRIIGKNFDTKPKSSNGAGKSSIIEAVMFALFGKTIRKTNDKSLKNYHTKGKCRVVLTVNGDTVIERVKKAPMLSVTVGGENCTQESIGATQKYLQQILNINHHVFLASIVFGQGNATNFLTATPEEKRAIIQNFLSVGDLFKNRSTIKSLKSRYLQDKKVNLTLLNDGTGKVDKLQTRLKKLRAMKKESKSYFSSEKYKFIFGKTLSEIQEQERAFHQKDLEYEQVVTNREVLRERVVQTQAMIESLRHTHCEHCGKLSQSNWEKVQEMEKNIEVWREEKRDCVKAINKLGKEVDALQIPVTTADFETIERFKEIDAEIKIHTKSMRGEKALIKKYGDLSTAAQKQYDIMRFWEHAFSEAGLIKYVIRHILDYLNERCNSYLSTLSKGNFIIKFDDSLGEEIYNKGSIVYFDSLSGGEKKRVSLAVMLGLNDLLLLTGKDRSNIIFFDEVADSFDADGVKGLIELIHQLTKHKKLFLITHNEYLTSLLEEYSETLTVTKRNNITKITK
jgi:DNA repair exonuclease SbcCD ATPase subunit